MHGKSISIIALKFSTQLTFEVYAISLIGVYQATAIYTSSSSSISSVGNWKNVRPNEQVLEIPISTHDSAQDIGYRESKNIAEYILHVAKEKSGLPVSILRAGQIAGPVTIAVVLNRNEWFPSLINT